MKVFILELQSEELVILTHSFFIKIDNEILLNRITAYNELKAGQNLWGQGNYIFLDNFALVH